MRVCLPPRRHAPPAGAPSWGLQVMQWLIVLLLAWDQVGSPLHRHHHDSGVDGHALAASHGNGAIEDVRHVEDADGGFHFSHAVMAVRPQSQLSPIAADEARDVAIGEVVLALANAEWVADPQSLPWLDARPATHSPHRSLPPAGRAPPLHA